MFDVFMGEPVPPGRQNRFGSFRFPLELLVVGNMRVIRVSDSCGNPGVRWVGTTGTGIILPDPPTWIFSEPHG